MIRIVDASVVVKWLIEEEGSDRAAQLMRLPLVAPESLVPECLSALRRRVQRGLMIEKDAVDAAHVLALAGIAFEPVQSLAPEILVLSLRLSLSTYDCAYEGVGRATTHCPSPGASRRPLPAGGERQEKARIPG